MMNLLRRALTLGVLLLALPAHSAVDLNSASVSQLQMLRGVGAVKARTIVVWRKRHGPFRCVDDLKQVPDFGEKLLNRLRPQLTVQAPARAEPHYSIERRQGR